MAERSARSRRDSQAWVFPADQIGFSSRLFAQFPVNNPAQSKRVDRAEMMMKTILMVCAAATLWASSAMAQQTSTIGPCTSDELRLCSGTPPGRYALRACFRAHIQELSDTCLVALTRLSAVDKTCRARLDQECAGVQPGGGLLEACLRTAAAKLDDTCKDQLSRAISTPR